MKATATRKTVPPPPFEPVRLEIIFESRQELDTFAALFNYTPVCDLFRAPINPLNGAFSSVIRFELIDKGADPNTQLPFVKETITREKNR